MNVGRTRFDQFLNAYFSAHAFKTITTEQFLAYLDSNLMHGDTALQHKIGINQWVYGPGIPANCPRAGQQRFQKVDSARAQFLLGTPPAHLATKEWSTHEWLHFLRKMPRDLTTAQMKNLDAAFRFTNSGNSEIADLWFIMAVRAGYTPAYPAMELFLSSVGRRKFLEPVYSEMIQSSAGRTMAHRLYAQNKMNYHPLAQESLEKLLQWNEKN